MGEKITIKRPDGKECSGYYAMPSAGENASSVVVLQEWWGLNDQIKGVANRLAEAGYRALVPDLYKGKVTLEAAEAEHLMGHLDFGDAATQDIRGAVQYLKENTLKVALLGFCMGGALSILAAVHVKEVDAVVCWYGIPPQEAADPSTIKIPLQGHFAQEDEHFTPAQVDVLESRLKEGNVPYEIHRYQADHAFGNETGDRHDPEAANLAWQRTFDFLAKHIK
jgi:carboxymethylenebutenolidase